jgi:hypothetical protein
MHSQPSLQDLPIDDRAVADVVLVESDTGMRTAQQLGEPGLAHLDRQSAQVLAVEFEQVEGAEHGRKVRPQTTVVKDSQTASASRIRFVIASGCEISAR